MIVKSDLSRAYAKVRRAQSFLIGTDRVSHQPGHSKDFDNLSLAFVLWCGILSDCSNFMSERMEAYKMSDDVNAATRALHAAMVAGRIKSDLAELASFEGKDVDLTPFLLALDGMADVQLKYAGRIRSFKEIDLDVFFEDVDIGIAMFPDESRLRNCNLPEPRADVTLFSLVCRLETLIILLFENEVQYDERCMVSMSWMRQLTSFMKKVVVDRPSLATECAQLSYDSDVALEAFFEHIKIAEDDRSLYESDVLAMRKVLHDSGLALEWEKTLGIVPGHGKGVVGTKGVRTWYEKYQTMRPDARVAYLLCHTDLGSESDYSPLIKGDEQSSRISRFIPVPKNWKKMRGISAEPAELQFWQQGVMFSLDRALRRNIFFRNRIDIHDQLKSQKMCLSGSSTGLYATVDLSNASDSVSIKLVRDVFGKTQLCRWLLGTRSVSTDFGFSTRQLTRFAPMGSATCFPVESIIFALVAEVAVMRTRAPGCKRTGIRAYGDDIILPTYAYDEAVAILHRIGFTVNTEKSFHQGGFRESCGAEGWLGVDINPIRFKQIPIPGFRSRVSPEIVAASTMMANALFERGFSVTRKFFLELIYSTYFQLKTGGKSGPRYPSTLASFFTFDGDHSTVASPQPTNFHLRRKYHSGLQTIVYEVLVWRKRGAVLAPVESNLEEIDACRLVEWLIRHGENHDDIDVPLQYQCTPQRRSGECGSSSHLMASVFGPAGFETSKAMKMISDFIHRSDGVANYGDGLSTESLSVIANCGIDILRSYIHDYKEMDERYHLCFTHDGQSFANMGALGRYSATTRMVPTVKWVCPAWLDASSLSKLG